MELLKETWKEMKNTSNSEKFWTGILVLIWISIGIIDFNIFSLLQLLFLIFIFIFIRVIGELEEKNNRYYSFLWVFTSIFTLMVLLFHFVPKVVVYLTKRFNNWLNKL